MRCEEIEAVVKSEPKLLPTARVRVEFTIEPFRDGAPGKHVIAAVAAAKGMGLKPEMGPFGTGFEGDATLALGGIGAVIGAALANGASRVSIQVESV